MTGASPLVMTTILEGLGVDGFGMNCSLGPKLLQPVAQEVLKNASLPVLIKPNAGLPITENGVTRYDVDAQTFADEMHAFIEGGARIVGGCCGTTPAHIAALVEKTKNLPMQPIVVNAKPYIASYIRAVDTGADFETGGVISSVSGVDIDIDTVIDEAFEQKAEGVEILHVCINGEGAMESLSFVVESIQEVLDLPICLQSDNVKALEKAMRRYNGKPLIKCGAGQTMEDVLPLVQKYGGVCIE
jgi:5-methyltetrahydrofolate--homocysteine methyltransferase